MRNFSLIVFAMLMTVAATPSEASGKQVRASWYGYETCSKRKVCRTASGERFNQDGLTAAHKSLPFGTKVRVTYHARSIVVTINDRGPFIKGRSLDLSKGAARKLGCSGVCLVSMTVLD